MKSNAIKFSAFVLVCFFTMASLTAFAQNNGTTRPNQKSTPSTTTTPTGGVATTPPNTTPANGGKPAAGSKSYSTQSDFVQMMITNGKEGDIVKYRAEFNGKTEDKEIKVGLKQTTASASICYENSRNLKITYSSTNPELRVSFKDTPTCSDGRKAKVKK